MGVLRPEDWRGQWIVAPWVSESLLLRKEFQSRPGLKRALVHVCGLGQHELSINGGKVSENLLSPGWTKYNRTCLYETHDVTELVKSGANAVGVVLGDGMYNTERRNRFSKFQGTFGPQRLIAQVELEYADGTREVDPHGHYMEGQPRARHLQRHLRRRGLRRASVRPGVGQARVRRRRLGRVGAAGPTGRDAPGLHVQRTAAAGDRGDRAGVDDHAQRDARTLSTSVRTRRSCHGSPCRARPGARCG